MATPRETTDGEAVSFDALSNDELADLWSQTLRVHALRRTGSTRDYWHKFLQEDDVIAVLAEFKRRALERQEEYEAWVGLQRFPPL